MSAQSAVPMGRKRTRDFDLPPRLYARRSAKGVRFYYVTHEQRWIPLGPDLVRAKRLWADYECIGCAGTVADMCERYIAESMPKAAASTRRQYKAFSRVIRAKWGTVPADLLKPYELARWRDETAPGWGNGVLSLLRVAYAKAIEWGWAATNPASGVAFNEMAVRERDLTDAEFRTIRLAMPAWGKVWMDVSYCTSLRPSDVLALRWDQVGETLTNRTRKTNVRQSFTLSDDLRTIFAEAKNRAIVGLFVVATDKGRPISLRRLQAAFHAACVASGVVDATPRDVRAKSAMDAEAQGLDFQAMLGHSDRRMSERYLKGKRVVNAPTLRRK